MTVTDVVEAVTEFSDNFASPIGQFLDDRTGYELFSGTANKLSVGTGGVVQLNNVSGTTVYRLPDIGRVDNFKIQARFRHASSTRFILGPDPATGQRVRLQRNNSTGNVEVHYFTPANVETIWVYSNPTTNLVELRVTGETFQLLINGVVQTPSSGPTQSIPAMSASSRFFLAAPLLVS